MDALKEWAVTVRALAAGTQVITLRKGGIREPEKHFGLKNRSFFLFPTFDHQLADLIRPQFRGLLEESLEDGVWPSKQPPPDALSTERTEIPSAVKIIAWAKLEAGFEVEDPALLEELEPFHIWTANYAEKRLSWKPRHPLHVLLLRAFRLPEPATVELGQEHLGCKSWIDLESLEFEGTPVLSDSEFEQKTAAVNKALSVQPVSG